MKKIMVAVMMFLFLVPSMSMSFESMKKHTKIEKDTAGGYSEHQKDYKAKMHHRDQRERRGGYYESGYHNKSSEFKQGEYQFVKSGKRSHPKKK